MKILAKQWKLSPMDLEARRAGSTTPRRRTKCSRYRHPGLTWYVVEADDKRTARLNLISHLLEQIPYEDVRPEKIELPPRQERAYVRPPVESQTSVPLRYVVEQRAAAGPAL